jgi:probable rRNA maturation factor
VLQDLARRLPPKALQVQLVLADDACLRRLNRQFRHSDRATDVLSFLYDEAPKSGDPGPHAELYVSLPRARRQAQERRHSLRRELVLLTLHGLLHLQGHDHERPGAARRMRSAEVPHLRWLRRRMGWTDLQPLVPAAGTAQG